MTSFHNNKFIASYNRLVEIFGEPDWNAMRDEGYVEKTYYEWTIENNAGNIFNIYDYNMLKFKKKEIIEWNIGAETKELSNDFYRKFIKKFPDLKG